MEFVRIIKNFDHLWAVKDSSQELDELTGGVRKLSDINYLMDFFSR